MPADMAPLVDDLATESDELFAVLAPLTEAQWQLATPADGWSIADAVSHLAYFDDVTTQSIADPVAFEAFAATLIDIGWEFPDRVAEEHRGRSGADLLAWFRQARSTLIEAFREADPTRRLPWFGPPMSPASSVTARLMETWAHGQDVYDTLGLDRVPTARLRHVAHIGISALKYSYLIHDTELPTDPIRVELAAPDGSGTWTWGPEDAADRVTGTALDFCLVVTQRRNIGDTALVATGPTAQQWISIAQSFAGAAGTGRAPMSEWSST